MTPFEAQTALALKLWVECRDDEDFKTGTIKELDGHLAKVTWNDGTEDMVSVGVLQDGRMADEKYIGNLYNQPLAVTLTVSDWATIECTLRQTRRDLEKDWPASAETIERITDKILLQTKAATTAADIEASTTLIRKYGDIK
jgi:hypothetical protein